MAAPAAPGSPAEDFDPALLSHEKEGELLRALEERRIRPVGSSESQAIDVRVISATHRNLEEKIASGEQNATTAYMTGKLKIKGDMGAAMKLQKLF